MLAGPEAEVLKSDVIVVETCCVVRRRQLSRRDFIDVKL